MCIRDRYNSGKHPSNDADTIQTIKMVTEQNESCLLYTSRIMKELYNIDMEAEGQFSKLVSDIPEPDIAISMGCNVGLSLIHI